MTQHNTIGTECTCLGALYGRELSHRANNALQQAIAAISVCRRGDRSTLDHAMRRLTAAANLQQLLGDEQEPLADLAVLLDDTCAAALVAAGPKNDLELHLDTQSLLTDRRLARPMLMIAAELVANAIRHAFPESGGSILVLMLDDGVETRLLVEDTGRCEGWRRPGGQGAGIVDDLARAMGGHVDRKVTQGGSARILVSVPSLAAAARTPAGAA